MGIILFTDGMKEVFAAGIRVILSAVFAEFLKNLLETSVPEWRLRPCVGIGTGAAFFQHSVGKRQRETCRQERKGRICYGRRLERCLQDRISKYGSAA